MPCVAMPSIVNVPVINYRCLKCILAITIVGGCYSITVDFLGFGVLMGELGFIVMCPYFLDFITFD